MHVGENTLMLKLAITYSDGSTATVVSDTTWQVCKGGKQSTTGVDCIQRVLARRSIYEWQFDG